MRFVRRKVDDKVVEGVGEGGNSFQSEQLGSVPSFHFKGVY
jgi:hypothetical protein